jgi:methylenetetrahydrofolate dehydrogenase (NADP+)/methenyltetrahydrofolate cyclohydrolase
VVIIDIGISKVGDKVKGDVNAESVKNKAGYLTPVPGGVGPITIAAALKNTVEIWKNKKNI